MYRVIFHIKNHYLKYLGILSIVILFIGCLYLSKGNAVGGYVFSRSIGGVPTMNPGDKYFPFSYANDVTVDPQGNIYLAQYAGGIYKFDSNGNYLLTVGAFGFEDGKFLQISRIATDSQGNLYVSDNIKNQIQKFDSNGNFLLKFGSTGSGDGQFSLLVGLAVDSNNNVYATDGVNNNVQVFDSNGNFVSKFGSAGTGDGQFSYPMDVAFSSDGTINVIDYYTDRVQRFSSSTRAYLSTVTISPPGGQVELYSIAIDDFNNTYLYSDFAEVYKYDSSDTYIDTILNLGVNDGQLFGEQDGIDIGPDGKLYIADYNKLQIFDTDGVYINKIAPSGNNLEDGVISYIGSSALDNDNNLYIADYNNNRIQKFDSNGNFLLKFGSTGSGDGQFTHIGGITVATSGDVYAADTSVGRIQKFDSNGNYISQFGSSGSGDGQLNSPAALVVSDSGDIYVSDSNNMRIQKFDSNGNYVSQFSALISESETFVAPSGISFDEFGNIFVVDTFNGRVLKFDSSGNYISSFGTYGPNDGQFNFPTSISVSNSGDIYIANGYNNKVSVWSPAPPLSVSSISSNVSTSSATITWTSSEAASSQVEYGPTTSYGTSTVETNTSPRVTNHSVTLNNLPTCTTFYYRVKSTNSSAVTTLSTSTSFTTAGCTGMAEVIVEQSEVASKVSTSTVTLETIELSIPPSYSTSSATTTFQAKKLEPVVFYQEASTPTGKVAVGTSVFNLLAIETDTNTKVTTFSSPILVSITYSSSDLNGIDPNTLSIYRYDGSSWFPLSNCSTNTNTNTVSCYTTQFSDFALFAVPKPAGGAAYYQVPGDIDTYRPVVTTTNAVATVTQTPIQQAINSLNTVSIKFSRTLKRGMSGADVSTLQQFLASIPGIYPEALITGYFGNLTYKAVKRYQCQYNIVCQGTEGSTGWGSVGPRTRGMMNR